MRYLGFVAAVVVIACVYAYVTRMPSPSTELANSNSYGATIDAVRNTVNTAAGAEQRRKWAIEQQMKTYGSGESLTYSTEGSNAEMLVAVSAAMNSLLCAKIADGKSGKDAVAAGFTSLSCRTTSGVVVLEKGLR